MIEIRVRFKQQLCGILLLLIIILSMKTQKQGHKVTELVSGEGGLNRSLRILRSEFHCHPTQTHSSYIPLLLTWICGSPFIWEIYALKAPRFLLLFIVFTSPMKIPSPCLLEPYINLCLFSPPESLFCHTI